MVHLVGFHNKKILRLSIKCHDFGSHLTCSVGRLNHDDILLKMLRKRGFVCSFVVHLNDDINSLYNVEW
jgi:hypothetical protein